MKIVLYYHHTDEVFGIGPSSEPVARHIASMLEKAVTVHDPGEADRVQVIEAINYHEALSLAHGEGE